MASQLSLARVRRQTSSRGSSCEPRLPFEHCRDDQTQSHALLAKQCLTVHRDIIQVTGSLLTEEEKSDLEQDPGASLPLFYVRKSDEVLALRVADEMRRQTKDNQWLVDTSPVRPPDRPSSIYSVIAHDHISFRYEVVQEIGRGRHSRVIAAVDHGHPNRHIVAIKIFHKTEQGRSMKSRWLQEVNSLKMLRNAALGGHRVADNRHVILMLSTLEFDGHYAITMAKHEMTLADDCIAGEAMAPFEVKQVVNDILHALAFLHGKGIVHTDIRMQNVLIDRLQRQNERRWIQATVADFGSAVTVQALRRYDGNGWRTCSFAFNLNCLGSTNLRAPEVILNYDGKIGSAMDMWAAGCLFLRLLTGMPLVLAINGEDESLAIREATVLQTIEQRIGSIVVENGGLRRHKQLLRRLKDPMVGLVRKERLGDSIFKESIFVKRENSGFLALDLLYRLLHLNSDKRAPAQQMLSHSYFKL